MTGLTPSFFNLSAVRTMSDDLPVWRADNTLQYSPASVRRTRSSSAGLRTYEAASRSSVPPTTKNSADFVILAIYVFSEIFSIEAISRNNQIILLAHQACSS